MGIFCDLFQKTWIVLVLELFSMSLWLFLQLRKGRQALEDISSGLHWYIDKMHTFAEANSSHGLSWKTHSFFKEKLYSKPLFKLGNPFHSSFLVCDAINRTSGGGQRGKKVSDPGNEGKKLHFVRFLLEIVARNKLLLSYWVSHLLRTPFANPWK